MNDSEKSERKSEVYLGPTFAITTTKFSGFYCHSQLHTTPMAKSKETLTAYCPGKNYPQVQKLLRKTDINNLQGSLLRNFCPIAVKKIKPYTQTNKI